MMPKNLELNASLNGTCSICQAKLYSNSYCETCYLMLKLLGKRYDTSQIMTLFSHSIGAKITQTLAETMAEEVKLQYDLKTGKKNAK